MDKVRKVVEDVKEAVGPQQHEHTQRSSAYAPFGTSHAAQKKEERWRTAGEGSHQTGPGVVSSVEEAGHSMQEQQSADDPGYYNVQQQFKERLEEYHEKK